MTTEPISEPSQKNAGADPTESTQQPGGLPPCEPQAGAGGDQSLNRDGAARSPGGPLTPEKTLAEELGLPRAQLAKLRASVMIEGEHWTKVGNLVQWTLGGIEALRAQLGKKDGGADPDALAEALAAPARAELKPVILLVARIVSNTRVVLAQEEGPDGRARGAVVTVRGLRDSRLLHKGQRIQATADPQGPVWNWWGPHPKRRGQILVPKFDGKGQPVSAGARTPGGAK